MPASVSPRATVCVRVAEIFGGAGLRGVVAALAGVTVVAVVTSSGFRLVARGGAEKLFCAGTLFCAAGGLVLAAACCAAKYACHLANWSCSERFSSASFSNCCCAAGVLGSCSALAANCCLQLVMCCAMMSAFSALGLYFKYC